VSHPSRRPVRRTCLWCDTPMILEGGTWVCPEDGWTMPNREICPVCWALLPDEQGPGGEKVCPDCGHELWPPRDADPPPREVWYQVPGLDPYPVTRAAYVGLSGPPKRRGGGGRKSGRVSSPAKRKLDAWLRRRRSGET